MAFLIFPFGRLDFELTGQGEPVLFIHGAGVAGAGWKPQVDELSRGFQCLTFDHRGLGKSTADTSRLTIGRMASDARLLMDAAGWESAHVVGHSMGGLVAQQLALDAPHRVRSLSLLCTFSKGAEATRFNPWTLWMGLRTSIGTRAMRRKAFLEMIFPPDYLRRRSGKALAERVARDVGRDLADQPDVLMKQLAAMRGHDCSSRLGELAGIPTLVVSGGQDPIARAEYGQHLSELIPNSGYVEIPNVSHGVIYQEPRRMNRMLREHFLEADVLNYLTYAQTA